MAILQVLGTDKALRLNDYPLLNLVSSFDWAPNFNAQDIYEMGSTTKIDTSTELETSGSFELSSTGNTAGLLARMKPKKDASEAFLGYTYDSGSVAGKNAYTFTQDDLADIKFDILMHEKTNQRTFNRSLWLPCAYLTSFSGRADSNGMAMETFNFAGSFVYGFPEPFHDVRSIPAAFVAVSGTSTKTSTLQLVDVSNGNIDLTSISSTTHTAAYAVVDGTVITNDPTNDTTVALGVDGEVTITSTEGFVVPETAQVTVLVYKTTSPSTTFPTAATVERFAEGAKAINYIKGYQANIYLAPTDGMAPLASEKWLRVQSIDWNVDLRVETLRQIAANIEAGTSIYARVPTFPLSVSANISVVESDWADWKALMTGKTHTGTDIWNHTFEFTPQYMKNEFAVVIEYFTKSGTKVQTTRLLDLRVDGYGSRQSVGGRGEISWSMVGTEYRVEGLNP